MRSDRDLDHLERTALQAAQAAARQAESAQRQAAGFQDGLDERLRAFTALGASDSELDRARRAAQDDIRFATDQATDAHARSRRFLDQATQIRHELQQRETLSPRRRQAENTGRRHLAAQAPQPAPQQRAPDVIPAQFLRHRGPQHSSGGRG
ncbi:hypothetical protein M1P56_35500 (plasmid) [Streptomyces sp. HU2014]|uniref:hypothetical protein n=1 Tax=Streptomyces sp. HU2014 TaxID=2939414 RepID=UPI00200F5E51|nr:hypothetical protein [Streptomyces sp. HU2014]UQI49696.1 hypothetical protein M1P56_35500 [Streptomyces sp. HU2014]